MTLLDLACLPCQAAASGVGPVTVCAACGSTRFTVAGGPGPPGEGSGVDVSRILQALSAELRLAAPAAEPASADAEILPDALVSVDDDGVYSVDLAGVFETSPRRDRSR